MKKVMLGLMFLTATIAFSNVANAGIPEKMQKQPQLSTTDSVALRSVVSKTTKKFAGKAAVNRVGKKIAARNLVNKVGKKFAARNLVNKGTQKVG